ncbi:MAG: hypothetical protein Q8Q62_09350 [Mesorhizobium sp.]|nr:hypothetical protein [Mesorhizobium sp.]
MPERGCKRRTIRAQAAQPAEPFYAAAGFVMIPAIQAVLGEAIARPAINKQRRLP